MNLLELGKTPIRPESPAGDDVRYDPDFEELQKEIDKLSFASGGAGVNWRRVADLAADILEKKSKNLQVATYLAAGLIELQTIEGFSVGLEILKDLIENYWDDLYPPAKRMRGRINAMTWWMDRSESFFKSYEPDSLAAEIVNTARDRLSALDQTFSEKCDEAPMLSRLNDYLNRLPIIEEAPPEPPKPAQAPEPERMASPTPQPAPEAAAPISGKPAPVPSPSPPPTQPQVQPQASVAIESVQSRQDADDLIKAGLGQLDGAATYLLKQDMADPTPYRLARQAAWLAVDRLPMADSRQTMLPPPESMIRTALDNLLSAKDYETAVSTCESKIGEFLFWLDLSRLTSQALEALGPRYRTAADTVAMETAYYVSRLRGLEKLTFSDGTPFADAETKAWLNTIVLGADRQDELPKAEPGGIAAQISEAYGHAQELIKENKAGEAVRLLNDRLSQSSDGQTRLRWRIVLVKLLLQLGRSDLARTHVATILDKIEKIGLETWDRELALSGLKAAFACLKESEDEESLKQADKAMGAIARIDPAEALTMSGA